MYRARSVALRLWIEPPAERPNRLLGAVAGAETTAAEAAETAVVVPPEFVAETAARTVAPTSALETA
jgi:hypothetical protein